MSKLTYVPKAEIRGYRVDASVGRNAASEYADTPSQLEAVIRGLRSRHYRGTLETFGAYIYARTADGCWHLIGMRSG